MTWRKGTSSSEPATALLVNPSLTTGLSPYSAPFTGVTRTAKEAWAAIKSDTLKQAEIHAGFVRELQEHAERPLLDFKEQQKLKKKDVCAVADTAQTVGERSLTSSHDHPQVWYPSCQMENIIVKDRKNMASREADIERVRKVHQQRLKDVEAAERAAARGLNDRKDLSKVRPN